MSVITRDRPFFGATAFARNVRRFCDRRLTTVLFPADNMQSTDIFRLISRRTRRRLIIFPILYCVGFASTIWAAVSSSWGWSVAGFFAAVLFYVTASQIRKNHALAWRISENPELVYWAHPINDRRLKLVKLTSVMLHLRDGHRLEVGLSPDDIQKFAGWLREQNPSVRWGDYD